uniref:Uncharacterized protein n=1 Tax=Bacteriophage sp. TaxID=38018 RepID=A0A8D9PEZ8_9VIRU|nr:MAG TPA: hypothetical protein [Bacteriophage sp.]
MNSKRITKRLEIEIDMKTVKRKRSITKMMTTMTVGID